MSYLMKMMMKVLLLNLDGLSRKWTPLQEIHLKLILSSLFSLMLTIVMMMTKVVKMVAKLV
jgi:hypothetical protein